MGFNMEDHLLLKGRLEPKSNILSHPDMYEDVTLLCFVVSEAYKGPLRAYYTEQGIKEYQELMLSPWPLNPTERGRKFFFKLRDVLAEKMGDMSRQHKDHLYRSCVRELDLRKEGKIINSLKDLDKRGLWMATEVLHGWAVEAGADLRGLIPEYTESQKGLRE